MINQVQDLQVILHDIHAEGMSLSESFKVAAIIEKLPPLWKEFKNYLKHKRKEMRLEDLIVRLRIEEDNRASEKKASVATLEPDPTRLASPNRNPGDARLILFYLHFYYVFFFKSVVTRIPGSTRRADPNWSPIYSDVLIILSKHFLYVISL